MPSRRYLCALCDIDDLPGFVYLDRLKKGADPEHSLEYHVETYHPEVVDWMSARAIPYTPAPGEERIERQGIRARAAAQAALEDTDESDEGAVANDSMSVDSDTIVVKPRPRRVLRSSSSSEGPSSASSGVRAPTVRGTPEPQAIPAIVLHTPPAPTRDIREENITLLAANQQLERVNNSLRQQVQGLLNTVTNVVEEIMESPDRVDNMQSFPYTRLHVTLMRMSHDDGQLVEQITGRVAGELRRRQVNGAAAQVAALSGHGVLAPRPDTDIDMH